MAPLFPSKIDRPVQLPVFDGWLGLAPLPPLGAVSDLSLQGPPPAGVHPEEWEHVKSLRGYRRATFTGGRQALRAAAAAAAIDLPGVLVTPRGAPAAPPPLCASVSHKLDPKAAPELLGTNVAAAFLARTTTAHERFGVDIEVVRPRRSDLARHILRPNELAMLDAIPTPDKDRAVLRAFSMKEALYKALDPHVQRYVGFLEVELNTLAADVVEFSFDLKHREGAFVARGLFLESGSVIVSLVRLDLESAGA